MNSIEALQEIYKNIGNIHYFDFSGELPKQTTHELRDMGFFEIILKDLKVLDILKNKECNVHALLLHAKRFDYPSGYNMLVGEKYQITDEEFALIKEWLTQK